MCTPRFKRKRLLLVLLLLVAAVAGWWFVAPRQRVYRGQPVSEWVRQLSITSLGVTNAILDVLLDIGPDWQVSSAGCNEQQAAAWLS